MRSNSCTRAAGRHERDCRDNDLRLTGAMVQSPRSAYVAASVLHPITDDGSPRPRDDASVEWYKPGPAGPTLRWSSLA